MKFILFNINDLNKDIINKIMIDSKHYINEVSLSSKKLDMRLKKDSKFIQNIKNILYDRGLEKKILKALESHDKKWYYVISNDIKNTKYNKYISSKAEEVLGYEVVCKNELDSNLFKYAEEYLDKNTHLKKYNLRVLLICKKNKNLNFKLLNNLIREYKNANIYLKEKPSIYIMEKIKKINQEEGTSIDIVNKDKKAFSDIDIAYFVDGLKQDFPRLRFNKNTLILDSDMQDKDKFNSNIIYINDYIKKPDVLKDNINVLMTRYNMITLACVVREIVN